MYVDTVYQIYYFQFFFISSSNHHRSQQQSLLYSLVSIITIFNLVALVFSTTKKHIYIEQKNQIQIKAFTQLPALVLLLTLDWLFACQPSLCKNSCKIIYGSDPIWVIFKQKSYFSPKKKRKRESEREEKRKKKSCLKFQKFICDCVCVDETILFNRL